MKDEVGSCVESTKVFVARSLDIPIAVGTQALASFQTDGIVEAVWTLERKTESLWKAGFHGINR